MNTDINSESIEQTPNYNNESKHAKAPEKKNAAKEALSWILCLVLAFAIAMTLRTFVFEFVRVDGDSMLPTLTTDERLFVEKLSKLSDDGIKHGDILIVKYPGKGDTAYVKRVVGLAGDTIEVREGTLYRNGEAVKEDYTLDDEMKYTFESYTVPEGNYFLLGDNRNDSLDSHMIGPIPKEDIVGHAVCVIWPIWEFKTLG